MRCKMSITINSHIHITICHKRYRGKYGIVDMRLNEDAKMPYSHESQQCAIFGEKRHWQRHAIKTWHQNSQYEYDKNRERFYHFR